MKTTIEPHKLNKRERRAADLLAHYATCERLAVALGMPAAKVDGKKISVALLKIEREAHAGATAQCNGEDFTITHSAGASSTFLFHSSEDAWEQFSNFITAKVARVFGRSHMHPVPGFFVNGDCRGYALKIDSGRNAGETPNPAARELIDGCRMHTDWGSYGILSPDITGD